MINFCISLNGRFDIIFFFFFIYFFSFLKKLKNKTTKRPQNRINDIQKIKNGQKWPKNGQKWPKNDQKLPILTNFCISLNSPF